ncbi:Cdc73 family RNA pol II accessory factor, partial [Apiospora marii]
RQRRSITRSISAMDGPMSRLPSSVTSITNHSGHNNPTTRPSTPGTPRPFYATQSLRDLHNSASFNSSSKSSRTPSSYGVDPPRPAKEGYEWVWFPGGYWAERERVDLPRHSSHSTRHFKWRKKSDRNSSSRDTGESDSTLQGSPKVLEPTMQSASQAPLASPWLSEEAHVASLQQPAPPQQPATQHHPISETGSSKRTFNGSGSESEVIPARRTPPSVRARSPLRSPSQDLQVAPNQAKKILEESVVYSRPGTIHATHPRILLRSARLFADSLLQKTTRKKESKNNDAYTQNTLEGARQRLANPGNRSSPLSRITTLLREENSKSPSNGTRQRKLFGKAPWRKASAGSDASATSSILEVLRGHTPQSSPVSETAAFVESSKRYCKDYPGGEATRVDTPPLRESTEERPPRSFFFDTSQHSSPEKHTRSPLRHQQAAPASRRPTTLGASGSGSQKGEKTHHSGGSRKSSTEWWEVPVAVPRWEDLRGSRTFEFDMPETLPNSPMCPANKKHKSGGTGVCVYHGRRKKSTPHVWGEMVNQKTEKAWEARNVRRESEG